MMLSGAVTIRCAATLIAPYTSTPIQHSHTTILAQAFIESGGIVSGCRRHGLISGNRYAAIGYLRRGRGFGSGGGSSMVITRLAPRFPHTGGAPAPTRMVTTGNGGVSCGHGVWQSVTITRRSIGARFRSVNERRPTPMSVPPPPYNSTGAPAKTFLTPCTAASQHATTTSTPCPSCRVSPPSSDTARANWESAIDPDVSIRNPALGRG